MIYSNTASSAELHGHRGHFPCKKLKRLILPVLLQNVQWPTSKPCGARGKMSVSLNIAQDLGVKTFSFTGSQSVYKSVYALH